MKINQTDPKVTALAQLRLKGRELAARAQAVEELLLAGDDEGLAFGAEMIRESVSAAEFWLGKLAAEVAK